MGGFPKRNVLATSHGNRLSADAVDAPEQHNAYANGSEEHCCERCQCGNSRRRGKGFRTPHAALLCVHRFLQGPPRVTLAISNAILQKTQPHESVYLQMA